MKNCIADIGSKLEQDAPRWEGQVEALIPPLGRREHLNTGLKCSWATKVPRHQTRLGST